MSEEQHSVKTQRDQGMPQRLPELTRVCSFELTR